MVLLILSITVFALGRFSVGSSANREGADLYSGNENLASSKSSIALSSDKSSAITFRNAAEAKSARDRLVALAKTDPLVALEFVKNRIHPLTQRELAITAILAEWAAHDPHGAWEWAQENSHNDLVPLLKEIAKVDSELAWQNAAEHTARHPDDNHTAYESTIEGLIYSGAYEDAVAKLDSIDLPQNDVTPHSEYSLLLPLIEKWAHYSSEEVSDWILALPDDPTSEKTSLANRALINHWAPRDPMATLDYSLKLPENGAKRIAVTASIEHLVARGDIEQASAWLNQHAQGHEYDRDVFFIATHPELNGDPETSIGWADTIVTPSLRKRAYREIAVEWMAHDREAAEAYFNENPLLTHEEQAEVQSMLVQRLNELNGMSHLNDIDDNSPEPEEHTSQ